MKRFILFFLSFCLFLSANAQYVDSIGELSHPKTRYIPITQYWKEHGIFQHLDASLNLGTTGIGIDVSSPVTEFAQLRAGFSFMPHFDYKVNFDVQVGNNPSESASKFQSLSRVLKDITGYQVNNSVDMVGEPTYYNFHVLFDVFPFKTDRHWHFTAGFYWGNSLIGRACNTTEDMPSLVAVGIYNNMYEKALRKEPFVTITMNGNPYAFTDDPEYQDMLFDKFSGYGRMGVRIGDYTSDGSQYVIEPDENSMVKVTMKANSFKPYLGFGYGGRLIKDDDRYKISFDCGAMFWGGSPSIITHDGTDLVNDVNNIRGKVGDYVKLAKCFKVFPVISVRFTRSFF